MDLVRTFETTVTDRIHGFAFTFLTIPGKDLSCEYACEVAAKNVISELLSSTAKLDAVRPAELPQVIARMVDADDNAEAYRNIQRDALVVAMNAALPKPPNINPSEEKLSFAEQIAFVELIPFEESPLDLVSLAAKSATGYAKDPRTLGAFIGVLAGGFSPYLLITVPAGIILCATANAFAAEIKTKMPELMKRLCRTNTRKKNKPTEKGDIDG